MSKRSTCATLTLLLVAACGESGNATDPAVTGEPSPDGPAAMEPSDGAMPGTDPDTPSSPMSTGSEGTPMNAPEPGMTTDMPAPEPGDPEPEPSDPVSGMPEPTPGMEPEMDVDPGTPEPTTDPDPMNMGGGPGVEPSVEPTPEPTMEMQPEMEPVDPGEPGDCRVWLSPDGDDAGDGSEGSPVASLLVAYDLVCPKPPDGTENGAECLGASPRTICVQPGTYAMSERLEFRKTRMGTAESPIVLQGAPGASERPVFDFSSQERLECGANPDNIGGLTINANYVTVRNIVVTGANDTCILMQGTGGLVENVLTYECADTGIQISSGGDYEGSGTNNTVRNCDSHSNYDVQCQGENADGFAIKEGTGTGNSFIGCRAWNNTDDGFDLYAWTSTVHIENSWAFDQCATNEDSGSDCNGFKLGGDEVSATHDLVDLIAVGNSRATGNGFTENSNPANLSCSGTCASWGNNVDVDSVSGVSTSPIGDADVNSMKADSARNADGSLKSISEL